MDLPKPQFDESEQKGQDTEKQETVDTKAQNKWGLLIKDALSPWGARCREKLKRKLLQHNSGVLVEDPQNKQVLKNSIYF